MRAERALILIQLFNLEKCHSPVVAVGRLRWDCVQGDSPQKKSRADTEAQLKRRELRAAKERESMGKPLHVVDIRVLLEELHLEGDDGELALLPKSREELVVELHRRRNRTIM